MYTSMVSHSTVIACLVRSLWRFLLRQRMRFRFAVEEITWQRADLYIYTLKIAEITGQFNLPEVSRCPIYGCLSNTSLIQNYILVACTLQMASMLCIRCKRSRGC